jgi:ABC-type cobalamin transport system ATPase subunit
MKRWRKPKTNPFEKLVKKRKAKSILKVIDENTLEKVMKKVCEQSRKFREKLEKNDK